MLLISTYEIYEEYTKVCYISNNIFKNQEIMFKKLKGERIYAKEILNLKESKTREIKTWLKMHRSKSTDEHDRHEGMAMWA